MLGNGFSGILMNIIRAILELVMPDKNQQFAVACIFYATASAILLLCAYLYKPLSKSPYFLYHKRKCGLEIQIKKIEIKPIEAEVERKEESAYVEALKHIADDDSDISGNSGLRK